MKLLTLIAILATILIAPFNFADAATNPPIREGYQLLPPPGKKVPLGENHYFIYGFDKPPKISTCIIKVEIFTRDGKQDTSFKVKGDADMPSMRGAHKSGDKPFSLSKKGAYLLPVRLVMPGDWEVNFIFEKNNRAVLRGVYLFDL